MTFAHNPLKESGIQSQSFSQTSSVRLPADSAFHAILGSWDKKQQGLVCDVSEGRAMLGDAIKNIAAGGIDHFALMLVCVEAIKQRYLLKSSFGYPIPECDISLENLNEYAQFLANKGEPILPTELDLIARINGITIHLYYSDLEGGYKTHIYNPGKRIIIAVYFDGIYYGRLGQSPEKIRLSIPAIPYFSPKEINHILSTLDTYSAHDVIHHIEKLATMSSLSFEQLYTFLNQPNAINHLRKLDENCFNILINWYMPPLIFLSIILDGTFIKLINEKINTSKIPEKTKNNLLKEISYISTKLYHFDAHSPPPITESKEYIEAKSQLNSNLSLFLNQQRVLLNQKARGSKQAKKKNGGKKRSRGQQQNAEPKRPKVMLEQKAPQQPSSPFNLLTLPEPSSPTPFSISWDSEIEKWLDFFSLTETSNICEAKNSLPRSSFQEITDSKLEPIPSSEDGMLTESDLLLDLSQLKPSSEISQPDLPAIGVVAPFPTPISSVLPEPASFESKSEFIESWLQTCGFTEKHTQLMIPTLLDIEDHVKCRTDILFLIENKFSHDNIAELINRTYKNITAIVNYLNDYQAEYNSDSRPAWVLSNTQLFKCVFTRGGYKNLEILVKFLNNHKEEYNTAPHALLPIDTLIEIVSQNKGLRQKKRKSVEVIMLDLEQHQSAHKEKYNASKEQKRNVFEEQNQPIRVLPTEIKMPTEQPIQPELQIQPISSIRPSSESKSLALSSEIQSWLEKSGFYKKQREIIFSNIQNKRLEECQQHIQVLLENKFTHENIVELSSTYNNIKAIAKYLRTHQVEYTTYLPPANFLSKKQLFKIVNQRGRGHKNLESIVDYLEKNKEAYNIKPRPFWLLSVDQLINIVSHPKGYQNLTAFTDYLQKNFEQYNIGQPADCVLSVDQLITIVSRRKGWNNITFLIEHEKSIKEYKIPSDLVVLILKLGNNGRDALEHEISKVKAANNFILANNFLQKLHSSNDLNKKDLSGSASIHELIKAFDDWLLILSKENRLAPSISVSSSSYQIWHKPLPQVPLTEIPIGSNQVQKKLY